MSDCHRLAIHRRHLDADVVGGKGVGLTKTLVLSGTTVQEHLTGAAVQKDVVVPSLAALVGGHRQ
jgi:ribonucleotide monophosphatase NagD (HAD superfamily)